MDLATRAYLVGAFILLMGGIAGMVLLIGKRLQSQDADSGEYDIAKEKKQRKQKPARVKKEKTPRAVKTSDKKPANPGVQPVGAESSGVQPVAVQPVAPAPVVAPAPAPEPAPELDIQGPPIPPMNPNAASPFGAQPTEDEGW